MSVIEVDKGEEMTGDQMMDIFQRYFDIVRQDSRGALYQATQSFVIRIEGVNTPKRKKK